MAWLAGLVVVVQLPPDPVTVGGEDHLAIRVQQVQGADAVILADGVESVLNAFEVREQHVALQDMLNDAACLGGEHRHARQSPIPLLDVGDSSRQDQNE